MTSINYNVAANTALRTLQQTNSALETSQNRVSTGLKIGEAKDNAAYWSISTTLKSDNKSLSTVKDALNLGAATIDTAYQGLNKTIEVLDEIKSKITAASQDGVDKKAVQEEIAQLQKQLVSIASASSFSGENLLAVNSGVSSYNPTKQVVSGVNKDVAGNFTIATIAVDTSTIALTDASANGEAILDAGKSGNTLLGGLQANNYSGTTVVAGTASAGTSQQTTNYAYTPATGAGSNAATETLDLAIVIDGNSFGFRLTDSTTFDTLGELVTQINSKIGSAGIASNNGGKLLITSNTTGTASNVNISTATVTGPGGTAAASVAGLTVTDGAGNEVVTAGAATFGSVTQAASFGASPIVLDKNDAIRIQVAVNGSEAQSINITRDTVSKALGTTNGTISSGADYATVLNQAFADANQSGVTASYTGGFIKLTSTVAGSNSAVNVTSVVASKGTSVLTLDVTTASKSDLANFLNVVNKATLQVTSAASAMGAVSSRITLQSTFVDTLIDTIDKGVSNLIDADLSEESTKLQALQTKQQLGIQALSIANSSTQNILSLFRS